MFLILWRFVVHPERVDGFLEHYGSEGTWAQLFRSSASYRGTDLIRAADAAATFITIDRWDSREAFEQFERRYASAYERLDRLCTAFTLDEELLGRYENLDN